MCSLIRRSAPASPRGSQGTGHPCIRFLPAWPFVPRPRRAVCLPLGEGGSGVSRKPETDEGLSPRRADCFPPGKPGARAVISLRRCGEGHPEEQTTIAEQIQSRQADVPHPLFPRRTFFPFASAPAAPGVQGNTPAALFPRFLSRTRNRAAGGLVGKDLTGFLVVANLTGCASAVAVRAVNACLRSIAPPLQIEASASI